MDSIFTFVRGLQRTAFNNGFSIALLLCGGLLVLVKGYLPVNINTVNSGEKDRLRIELAKRDSIIRSQTAKIYQETNRADEAERIAQDLKDQNQDLEQENQELATKLRDTISELNAKRTDLQQAHAQNDELAVALRNAKNAKMILLVKLQAQRFITGMTILGAILFRSLLHLFGLGNATANPPNRPIRGTPVFDLNKRAS